MTAEKRLAGCASEAVLTDLPSIEPQIVDTQHTQHTSDKLPADEVAILPS